MTSASPALNRIRRRRAILDVARHGRLILAGLVLLLVGASATYLWLDYRVYWQEAEKRLVATTDVIAEFVQQVFTIVDLTLHSVDDDRLTTGIVVTRTPEELHPIMRRAQSQSPLLQGLGLTDVEGKIISSVTSVGSGPDLSDREFFRVHRDEPAVELLISRPVIGRPQNVLTLPVSRRVVTQDGRFAGIIAARIDPEYFTTLFRVADADVVTLLRPDGVILARHPEVDLVTAPPVPQSNILVRARIAPRGSLMSRSAVDGAQRLAAYRALSQPAVVVTAALEASSINWAWLVRTYPFLILFFGGLVFLIVVARLVQRHARATEAALAETAAARESAEHAAEVKSTFLANMSHEIRTPLGGILGYADLLLKSDLGRQQTDWAIKLKSAGDQLLAVINDILDYSKLEAGNFSIDPKPVPLATLVDEMSSMMTPQAEIRGLALNQSLEPNLPKWIRIDPVRLKQILINLISNAIKFTDRGSVSISVARAKLGSRAALAFEVKDTGIGIPNEKVASVFERFTQADTKASRGRGGTGLGLSISRRLAELMEGTLALESQVGTGTTVRLTIPLIAAPEPAIKTAATPLAERIGRILLVDDLPMNLEIAGAMLTAHGHQVTTASSGVDAIDLALSGSFDAILLDINLPDLDGYEVAREIRKLEPPDRHTPILALTANALPEHVIQAMSAGMNGHISKPIEERVLTSELAKVLGAGPSAAGAAVAPERPLVDEQAVRTLRRVLGKERLLGLKAMFWRAWDAFLATTVNSRFDRGRLAAETHDLVSHAGNVGYLQLAHVCRELSYLAGHDEKADLAPLIKRAREIAEATRREDQD
jgi:signal transduction histidine kinase/DNA-binding NarL/FixJ family response regulator